MEFDEFDQILEQREAEKKAAEEQEAEDVEKYFIDYSSDIPKPKSVIYDPNDQDRIIVSEDNILVICGEAKSYKSFCASLLVIDYLHQHPDKKCIIIDTEQADWNCVNVGHRVCKGMGWKYADAMASKRLRIANLRRYSYEERKVITDKIIKAEKPYLCVIDGIRDLVHDINDSPECMDVVDKLMIWTAEYHCAILTILHTNKESETLRGHLGSELQNKAETVLFCKKNAEGNGVEVSSKYARNIDIDTFNIEINDQFVPVRTTKVETTKLICGKPKETECLNQLELKSDTKVNWLADIRRYAMCADKTAEKYFNDYVNGGFLKQSDYGGDSYAHFATLTTSPKPAEDTQTSFDGDNENDPF